MRQKFVLAYYSKQTHSVIVLCMRDYVYEFTKMHNLTLIHKVLRKHKPTNSTPGLDLVIDSQNGTRRLLDAHTLYALRKKSSQAQMWNKV